MGLQETRRKLLEATIAHVPFDGWSLTALKAGAADAGVDEVLARNAFPGGPGDLIDAFGPPQAQIETMRAELAETREQLDRLDDRLAKMEAMAERLAIASEQVVAFQEPFLRMAAFLPGFGQPASDGDGEEADDESGGPNGDEAEGLVEDED